MVLITIAIPSSILTVEHGLLLKTIRVFQVIRFSSIFRVSKIIVYRDPFTELKRHEDYLLLFSKIHNYLVTPPYLRRKLVSIDNDLKYVGALPPLRLLVYDVSRDGFVGEKRIGYKINEYVDIGLKWKFKIIDPSKCIDDKFVYVEIKSLNPPLVECISEKPYLGPLLSNASSLREVIEYGGREGYFILATSRHGIIPGLDDLVRLKNFEKILILYGAPKYGLYEISRREGFELDALVDAVWNIIPGQGVKTVRTEEALIASLAILNMFINR